jgi:hypothetical protein
MVAAGLLMMSTVDVCMDEFFMTHPSVAHGLSFFLMVVTGFFGVVWFPGHEPLVTLYCAPLLLALLCGKRLRTSGMYTAVLCAFFVLLLVAWGIGWML